VAIVGGGNSAGQAALFLSDRAHEVYLVARCDNLEDDMSRYLVDRIRQTPNIEPVIQHQVHELLGEDQLGGIIVQHKDSGELRHLDIDAFFVFIGADAPTAWLQETLELDQQGFIRTGPAVKSAPAWQGAKRDPFIFETSLPESSPSATCAATPSAAPPPPSARAQWPSVSATPTWRRSGVGDG